VSREKLEKAWEVTQEGSRHLVSVLKGITNANAIIPAAMTVMGSLGTIKTAVDANDPDCPREVVTAQYIIWGSIGLVGGGLLYYYKLMQTRSKNTKATHADEEQVSSGIETASAVLIQDSEGKSGSSLPKITEASPLIQTSQQKKILPKRQHCFCGVWGVFLGGVFTVTDATLNAMPYLTLTANPIINLPLTASAFLLFLYQDAVYVHEVRNDRSLAFRQTRVGKGLDVLAILMRGVATKISLYKIIENNIKWLAMADLTIFVTKYSNYQNNVDVPEGKEFSYFSKAFQIIANFAYALQDGALYTNGLLKPDAAYELLHCMAKVEPWQCLILLTALGHAAYYKKNGEFAKLVEQEAKTKLSACMSVGLTFFGKERKQHNILPTEIHNMTSALSYF